MYRVEYGQTAEERLQDRLDRMVAAVYPTMCMLQHQVYGSGVNQSLDEAVRVSVSLAGQLLIVVDKNLDREKARLEKTAEEQAGDEKLDALVAKMRTT